MRKFLLTVTAVGLLSLSACSLAPTYQRPEVKLDDRWPLNDVTQQSVANLSWERLYPDARLQALIRQALEQNHDLRIAIARQQEARALWGVQKSSQWPNISFGITGTGARLPVGAQGNQVPVEIQAINSGFSLVSYELDLWGRVANLSAAAKANFIASAEDQRAVQLGLISDVANGYWQLQEMHERFELAQRTLQTRQQSLELTRAKRQVGAASDLDVLLAEGSMASAQSDSAALDRQHQQAFNALKLLIGGEWPQALPAETSLQQQGVPTKLMADMPSEVLLRRPDVKAAEQRLMAANANIGAARAAYLPQISLTGALGSTSGTLSNLFTSGTRAWNFVPSATMPIFDAGKTGNNVDAAKAREVAAVAAYEKTLQTAFREVADLLIAQSTLQTQLDAQIMSVNSQTQRLRMVQKRFDIGSASSLELLDAQKDAYAAEQNLLQIKRQLFANTALLYKALGGGDDASKTSATNHNTSERT
jgi:outer membrane protein, multidrug efflux system